MSEYITCVDCDFVLRAAAGETPEPRHHDECPGCGGTEFEYGGH